MSSSTTPAPQLPPHTLSDLKTENDLLHLLFHRSKNQHHSSKWWKWLGMLRRSLKKLLDPAGAEGMEARLEYMRRIVVPSCYMAFTSLIANNQFAPLGLALLGTLARVHRIIGPEKKLKESEGEDEGIEETAEEATEELATEVHEEAQAMEGLVVGPVTMEDFGPTIRRERIDGGKEKEKVPKVQKKAGQGARASELQIKKPVVNSQGDVNREEPTVTERKKKEKKKATQRKKRIKEETSIPLLPPPRLPSPTREGPSKVKSKKKLENGEGVKKKRKRKNDEIDDLFAGLL